MQDSPTIELDVNDFADEVEKVDTQETTAEVSSTEETKAPEVVEESKDESSQDTEDEESTESKDEVSESEETEDEKPKAKNEANTRIRTLANENRELRQQVEQLNARAYTPPTAQELVDQGYSENDARVEALERRVEMSEFNRQVTELNYSLQTEAQQTMQDFPVFNPNSNEYNPELSAQVADLYQKSAGVQTDPNTGLVYSANVLPYNFYKTFADIAQSVAVDNQIKGQKASDKMLSATEPQSSATPKQPKEDPFLLGLQGGN